LTSARVILVGAGGHAKALLEALELSGAEVLGFVAPSEEGSRLGDVKYLGTDADLAQFDTSTVELVNGIGSVSSLAAREKVFSKLTSAGFKFASIVHSRAHVSPSARLGAGSQILVGAIVGAGVTIGINAIINSGAIVEHDSSIGDHTHVSPGAVIAGDVTVGSSSHVGLGARIIQGIAVGEQAVVGAGAVVISDVEPGKTVVGIPAR
jgi:sugar O-acyltransferase (sialic acid O-acetyltransferase NeuD family)